MLVLHQGWSGAERLHYIKTGSWFHRTIGFGLEKSPPSGSGDFYLECDGATPDEIWLVNDLLQRWQEKAYLPQATLIEDNDISLQFLPWKATVALMFYSLYVASSVWAAHVMEGKCVEIACFQTLMPMDTFFCNEEKQWRNKLFGQSCSQPDFSLFLSRLYFANSIFSLVFQGKAVETVATESMQNTHWCSKNQFNMYFSLNFSCIFLCHSFPGFSLFGAIPEVFVRPRILTVERGRILQVTIIWKLHGIIYQIIGDLLKHKQIERTWW